jgi:hypothetical protein
MDKDQTTIMNSEVAIFRDSKGEFKVVPDYVFLKKKAYIKFFAVNINVIVIVPKVKLKNGKENFCENNEQFYSSFQVKKGEQKIIRLKENIESGEYPYIIHCLDTGQTIKGNSPPSMIIIEDPPEE